MQTRVLFEDLTLKQFLRLPETKPALEYIDGEVVQKVSPKVPHSIIHTEFAASLLTFARPRKLGRPFVELRCTFGGRSLVPDLAFIVKGRIARKPDGQPVDDFMEPPDLAIEIISPGQTVKNLLARLTWCVRNGVRLGWLVQPRKQRVFVVRPERPWEVMEGAAVLSGEAVLPGFALPLTELFGWLTED